LCKIIHAKTDVLKTGILSFFNASAIITFVSWCIQAFLVVDVTIWLIFSKTSNKNCGACGNQ